MLSFWKSFEWIGFKKEKEKKRFLEKSYLMWVSMRLYNISFNKIRFWLKEKVQLKKNRATFNDLWGQTSSNKKYTSL